MPASLSLSFGEEADLSLTGSPADNLQWVIDEGPTGGQLTSNGHYTAPATPGWFHISVHELSGLGRWARAAVNVHAANAPPSDTLIEDAFEAGMIDAETRLTYRVFAAYHDPRLPIEYRGDDSQQFESDAQLQARMQFDALSASTQTILLPFVKHPFEAGSVFLSDPSLTAAAPTRAAAGLLGPGTCSLGRADIRSVDSEHFRVWYLKADEDRIARAVTTVSTAAEEAYQKLVASSSPHLRAPLGDGMYADGGCNGGDPRVDIMVKADIFRSAATISWDLNPPTTNVASYIVVNPDFFQSSDALKVGVAHEVMHAIQDSYRAAGKGFDGWLGDATASWAEGYVYPNEPDRHATFPAYEMDINNDLYIRVPPPFRDKGAWGLFQFLEKVDSPDAIRRIFEAHVTNYISASLDLALADVGSPGGGMTETWARFARQNWNGEYNRESDEKSYSEWEGISGQPRYDKIEVVLDGGGGAWFEVTPDGGFGVNPRSIQYFKVTFPDANVHSVVLHNGLTYKLNQEDLYQVDVDPNGWQHPHPNAVTYVENVLDTPTPGVRIELLSKKNGEWSRRDITNEPYVPICLDSPDSALEEMVIVVSNWDGIGVAPTIPPASPMTIGASNIGCGAIRQTAAPAWEGDEPDDPTDTVTVTATGYFGRGVPDNGESNDHKKKFFVGYYFPPEGGQSTIKLWHDDGVCNWTGTATASLKDSISQGVEVYTNFMEGPQFREYFFLGAGLNHPFSATGTCLVDDGTGNVHEEPYTGKYDGWSWNPVPPDEGEMYGTNKIKDDGTGVVGNAVRSSDSHYWLQFNFGLEFYKP